MLPCNMLHNVRLLCNLLNNWSNTQSQNKFKILAHGCLPPVKICKHRNLFLMSDVDRICAIIEKHNNFHCLKILILAETLQYIEYMY